MNDPLEIPKFLRRLPRRQVVLEAAVRNFLTHPSWGENSIKNAGEYVLHNQDAQKTAAPLIRAEFNKLMETP